MKQSELKKCKEELSDLQGELNKLIDYINSFFDFLPIPVCDLSSTFHIIQINKSVERLTGFDALEIVGEHVEKLFPEKEKVQNLISLLPKKKELDNKELVLIKKNKEKIIINSFWAARVKEEKVEGFFLAFIDITFLKKVHEEMEKTIKLRTQELRNKVEELEKFQKIAIGRELKMIELKEEIRKLKEGN